MAIIFEQFGKGLIRFIRDFAWGLIFSVEKNLCLSNYC